jgi:hypothetical protein
MRIVRTVASRSSFVRLSDHIPHSVVHADNELTKLKFDKLAGKALPVVDRARYNTRSSPKIDPDWGDHCRLESATSILAPSKINIA